MKKFITARRLILLNKESLKTNCSGKYWFYYLRGGADLVLSNKFKFYARERRFIEQNLIWKAHDNGDTANTCHLMHCGEL
jgi:hypothetical protein